MKRSSLKEKAGKGTWNEVKTGLRAIGKDSKRKGIKMSLEGVEVKITRRAKIERTVKVARKSKNDST